MNILKQTTNSSKATIAAVAAALAIALAVTGVFFWNRLTNNTNTISAASNMSAPASVTTSFSAQSSPLAKATKTPTATTPTPTPTPTPTVTASSMPPCEDGTLAPDGTCLHPASVKWLSDLLPDPTTVDRTDPDAVCAAYVITYQTWDASRDITTAYASIRSSVYETPEIRGNHIPNPDVVKGQGEFLPLVPGKSHTTVTIKYIATYGEHNNPERIPGHWHRTVGFVRTYADGSHEPVSSWALISLTKQEDGTWAVSNSDWHY